MTKNKDKRISVKKIFAGLPVGAIVLLLLSFIAALLISVDKMNINSMEIPIILINFISAAAAGCAASIGEKSRRLISSALSALLFGAAVTLAAFFISDKLPETAFLIRNFLCCMAGGILAAIIDLGKSNKKLRKYNTRRIRYNK